MRKKGKILRSAVSLALCAAMLLEPLSPQIAQAAQEKFEEEAAEEQLVAELAQQSDQFPKGGFAFYEDGRSVEEGIGEITVSVVRIGNTQGEDTVEVKTVDLTAVYGEDYEVLESDQNGSFVKKGTSETEEISQNSVEVKNVDLTAVQGEDDEVLESDQNGSFVKKGTSETEEISQNSVETKTVDLTADAGETKGLSLKNAKAVQTGVESDWKNWREAAIVSEENASSVTDAQLVSASMLAENEMINALEGHSIELHFDDGEYKKELRFIVKDDNLSEGGETAMLMLGNAEHGMMGEKSQIKISITDNDPDEDIVFAMKDSEVSVASWEEKVSVVIERTSGVGYFASAIVSTAALSAVPNGDYVPMTNREVVFAAGETEKTIEIPIFGETEDSVQFEVCLNEDETPYEEGRNKTTVSIIGSKEQGVSALSDDGIETYAYRNGTSRESVGGVNYTVYSFTDFWEAAATDNNVWRGWTYNFSSYMPGLTRMNVQYTVDGRNKRGLIWYYQKESRIQIAGSVVSHHDLGDKKSNRTVNYNEDFTVDAGQRAVGSFGYQAGSYWWNNKCYVNINSLKMYYPDFKISFDNSGASYKPRTYMSPTIYTEGSAINLGTVPGSKTLQKDGGSVYIGASCVDGAYVDHYEIYAKFLGALKWKLGDTASAWLSYSDMCSYLDKYQSVLASGGYQVVVKPVYGKYPAKVKFVASNKTMANFTDGFMDGNTFNCTRLDKVKVKGQGNAAQKVRVSSIVYNGTGTTDKTVTDANLNGKQNSAGNITTKKAASGGESSLSAEFSITRNYNYIILQYQDPTITVEYDPDEISNTETAGVGAVAVNQGNATSDPLAVGSYKEKIKLEGTSMSSPYITSFIPGEAAVTSAIPYKALWTYKTPQGEYKTVTGNNYVFTPYYADTLIQYYFKKVQRDESPVAVSGTVKFKETPLFTGSATNTKNLAAETLASGVELNIGGERVTTNSKGEYRTKAEFNKGEFVGVYLSYDSIYMVDNLDISKNRQYNPVVNVNDNDQIAISDTVMYKYVDAGSSIAGGSGVGQRKRVEVTTMYAEDANYELSLKTTAKGDVVPTKVEFRFYDVDGKLKPEFTQTVNLADGNTASLTLNPMSVEKTDGSRGALQKGDFMTVKVYDRNGKGYFEHHTNILVAEVVSSMYMFNYNGIKKEDDNAFIKAIGGISLGYDLVINSLANSFGDFVDDNGYTHHLCGIGFGEGYLSTEDSLKYTQTAYATEQEMISNIKNAKASDEVFRQGDAIQICGDDDGFSLSIQIGVIMDVMLGKGEDGLKKAEWYFNDFIISGKADASYSKDWNVPVGPIDLYFSLGFEVKDSGIQWHFTSDGMKNKYQVATNSTIDLLASSDVYNEGRIDLNAKIKGAAYAGVGASSSSFVGIGGDVTLTANTVFANNKEQNEATKTWKNSGIIHVIPKVKLKLSVIEIPLWTYDFRWDWDVNLSGANALNDAVNASLKDADILEASTANPQVIDRDYLKYESAWAGGDIASAYSISDASGVEETAIKTGIYSESKVKLQDLSDGKYLAVFTDDPNISGQENYRSAVYYSFYDGESWSEPKIIEEDGTNDELPVICEAGEKGYLIAWSDAGHASNGNETATEYLNDFNISGVFYNPDTNRFGDVMEITKETVQDKYADSNPQIAYYGGGADGGKTLMVYYTKSEYAASSEEAGETAGDLLSPYTVIAYRFYDFEKETWADAYTEKDKADIMGSGNTAMTEEAFGAYRQNWYGQVFLDLAPVVSITETIDSSTDRWSTEPVIESYDGLNDPVVTDSAMISFNGLSVLAYALDEDGNTSTNKDQNIYLQIYNMGTEEAHHAIRLTIGKSKIENLRFLRVGSTTYLYWLQDGVVMRQDVSNLVTNCLIKATDETTGREYYYIDRSEENDAYQPADVVADMDREKTETADVTEEDMTEEAVQSEETVTEEAASDAQKISGFSVYTNGDYIYTVWTRQNYNEDLAQNENHLYLAREIVDTHEMTLPVQVTDSEGAVYQNADFIVNKDGSLEALATRFTTTEDGALDTSSGTMVALSFHPKKAVSIQDITYGNAFAEMDEDGRETVYVPVSFVIENSSVESIENGVVTVSGTDDAEAISLVGGETTVVSVNVPADKYGRLNYTIKVKDGQGQLLSQKESGASPNALSIRDFNVSITERNKLNISASAANDAVSAVPESVITVGYYDNDGSEKELFTKKVEELTANESISLEEEVSIDFDTLFGEATEQEDGSYASNVRFFAKSSVENTTEVYDEASLAASGSQMELMESYVSIVPSVPVSNFVEGDVTHAVFLVTGETEAKDAEALGLKVNWLQDAAGIAEIGDDGSITAKKAGETTLKGYVMPQNTDYLLSESGVSEHIDNFATMPKEAVKEVSLKVTVKAKAAGETPGMETPGTETPGTETPGTEAPSTETSGTEKLNLSSAKIAAISAKTYTGKAIKPSVTVTYKGSKLKKNKDYTVSYKANKAIGTATVTVKGKENYTGTKKATFKIVPGKVTLPKISKNLKLSWKKVKGAGGYEIRYATKKKGSYKTLTTTKKTSVLLSNLSKLGTGRTYYIKIRAYKKVKGKKIYGSYSAVRKFKK